MQLKNRITLDITKYTLKEIGNEQLLYKSTALFQFQLSFLCII